MFKKWKAWMGLIGVVVIVMLVFPPSHFILRGWLFNESFYLSMPTSYWNNELQNWGNVFWDGADFNGHTIRWWFRSPSTFEKWIGKYLGQKIGAEVEDQLPLVKGDPAAVPVLSELLESQSIIVKRIAIKGLEELGLAAHFATPQLLRLAREKTPPRVKGHIPIEWLLRYEAIQAIRCIDPKLAEEFKTEPYGLEP